MQVYVSHSYRDAKINGYFLEHFNREQLKPYADRKTPIWCVAKLERHLMRVPGFVSIIPRRPTEDDPGAYSPHIAQELALARRARIPRLLFVDEEILRHHRVDFPKDAVPFSTKAPESRAEDHSKVLSAFRIRLDTWTRSSPSGVANNTVIVADKGNLFRRLAADMAELLRQKDYTPEVLTEKSAGRGLDDIRLLETLWRAEFCVFLLGPRLSEAYVALAMAHAHCIPTMRLLYDRRVKDCEPEISGLIRWSSQTEMLMAFESQLTSYKEGLVLPLEIANAATAADAMREVGRMKWQPRPDNLWDPEQCTDLLHHIHPTHGFVVDETNRARRNFGKSLAHATTREDSEKLCRILYEELRRHRFGYETEPPSAEAGKQLIRTPSQIETHKSATCIDMTCLFAAMLEATHQKALVAVLESPDFIHAIAGYRAPSEPVWENPTIGTVRGAVGRGDAVFFETTGAVEADSAVGAETQAERSERVLGFTEAKEAATRMLMNPTIRLKHFLDVRAQREQQQNTQ